MNINLNSLRMLYPFISIGSAGKSVLGKDIPYVKIGRGQKEVFYSASFHANEWITSVVLMKFLADYCYTYQNNLSIFGYSARSLYDNTTIYIIPMVNPDGVELIFNGSYIHLYRLVCKMQNEYIFFYFHLFQYNLYIDFFDRLSKRRKIANQIAIFPSFIRYFTLSIYLTFSLFHFFFPVLTPQKFMCEFLLT